MAGHSSVSDVLHTEGGDKDEDEKLLLPFTYILQVPGKNVREKLVQGFNHWLKIPGEKMSVVEEIVHTLHNAALLIDDIEDKSILRRGIPAAHIIYGAAFTMNASSYACGIAMEKVLSLNHPEAARVYTEQYIDVHRGQGMDIYWRDNYYCPTEDEYRNMAIKKSGALVMFIVRLMMLFSESNEDFTKLARILGLYFQIRNDFFNLCSQEYTDSKSYCEDLTEGKFSFPVVHAIRSRPDDLQVIRILRQRTNSVDVKKYCVRLLEKFGSFSYTRSVLSQLDKDARAEVQSFGGNPLIESILDVLLSWKKCTFSPIQHFRKGIREIWKDVVSQHITTVLEFLFICFGLFRLFEAPL